MRRPRRDAVVSAGSGIALVTGAGGNVGSEVCAELLRRGVPLRPPCSTSAMLRAYLTASPRRPSISRALRPTLRPSRASTAAFLMRPPHMAQAGAFDPFIAAMRAAGVRQVVFLSLLGAEKNPLVPHHAIEKRLRASGLGWTMVRPAFFMQNLTTTHLADLRAGRIVVPAGEGRTSFIDVRDVGAVAALALAEEGHVGKAYSITGGEALTYDECAALLSEASGLRIVYTRPSGRQFARHMAAQGFPPDHIRVMRGIYLVCRLRMAGRITDELPRLLGRPALTFAEFARDSSPRLVM